MDKMYRVRIRATQVLVFDYYETIWAENEEKAEDRAFSQMMNNEDRYSIGGDVDVEELTIQPVEEARKTER